MPCIKCDNFATYVNYSQSFFIINNILRAQDFYDVIVDEAIGRINYHIIEIESENHNNIV